MLSEPEISEADRERSMAKCIAKGNHPFIELGVTTLLAFIIFYQLIVNPIVGIANNGDFERIMGQVGLAYLTDNYEDKYWAYVNKKFAVTARNDWSHFVSSERLLVEWALPINAFVFGVYEDGLFDLRVLGAIHAVSFVLGVGLILFATRKRKWRMGQRLLLGGLMVFIFGDVGYVAYFNSIYSEPASLIFLCLSVGTALTAGSQINRKALPWIGGFFVASMLLISAKPQNLVLGPPLAAFGYRLSDLLTERRHKYLVRGSALVLVLFSGWYYIRGTPQYIKQQNLYNHVFYEILRTSPSPEEDLEALGVDRGLARLAGTTAYSPGVPINDTEFHSAFFDRVGYGTILEFYLAHPSRLLGLLQRTGQNALYLRPSHLGNFEKSSGLSPGSQSRAFDSWSNIKRYLFPSSLWFLLAFFLATFGALGLKYARLDKTRNDRLLSELHALLAATAVLQFLAASLGAGGELDIVKQLFLFNALFDACLIFGILYVAAAIFGLGRHW